MKPEFFQFKNGVYSFWCAIADNSVTVFKVKEDTPPYRQALRNKIQYNTLRPATDREIEIYMSANNKSIEELVLLV